MSIALAYSIAVILQTLVMFIYAMRLFELSSLPFLRHFVQALFAACVGGSMTYLILNFVVEGVKVDTFLGIFIQGVLGGVGGVCGVLLGYYAMRSPELTEVYRSFQAKLFKTDVVAPQEDVL